MYYFVLFLRIKVNQPDVQIWRLLHLFACCWLSNTFCIYVFLLVLRMLGASLVAQWLRLRLPVQGTAVRALVREDPTCRGATKSMSHNY